jgi:glucan phosphoethanolaminetransferase (alkaline phosphatase superfamily)
LHQPNYFFIENRLKEEGDDIESHRAALQYIDKQWPLLMDAFKSRGKSFHIYCSDHGTCYGEDGFYGHRIAHPHVLNVPYTHFIFDPNNT